MKKLSILFLFYFVYQFATAQTLIPYLKLNGKIIFVDSATMKPVIEKEFESALPFEEGLSCVRLNGKYGYIDKLGKEIIGFKYDAAGSFKQGLATVGFNNLSSLIDKAGNELIPFKYQYISEFHDGLAVVNLNNKFGYIDNTGKEIISCQYDNTSLFYDGLGRVKLNNKYGFINKAGTTVVLFKYDDGYDFSNGAAIVRLNKKYGCIDKKGKEFIPLKYDNIGNSTLGELLNVAVDSGKADYKWGFIDRTGKIVVPLKYNKTSDEFFNNVTIVNYGGQIQFINKKNEKLAALDNYDDFIDISEDLVFVKLKKNMADGGKYTLINMQGKEITTSRFEMGTPFHNGLANVKSGGKWGYIDKAGKTITSFYYDHVASFNNGLAKVKSNNTYFYIDRSGREYRETLPPLATGWLFSDDFTDNRNEWLIDSTSQVFQTVLSSNGYDLWNKSKDKSSVITRKIKDLNEKDNYRVEATIRYTAVGPENTGSGLIFGSDQNFRNYYRFLITKDGRFSIYESIVGQDAALQDWKASDYILKCGNNKLGFTHINGQWTFYINEMKVFGYKARELPGHETGLFIGPGSNCYCKSFKVYDWTKAATDPASPKEPIYDASILDNFVTNPYSGWGIINDDDVTSSFTGDAYRIKSKYTGYYMPSLLFGDADMPACKVELDARQIDGDDNHGFGMCFGKKDADNSFVFNITANGYFQVGRYADGKWVDIKEWTASDAIRTGHNANNYLRFINEDRKWSFYINDKLVYTHFAYNFPGKAFGCTVENKQTVDFLRFRFSRIVYP